MSRVGYLLNLYRHSRGFGVHSPWAYTIIREVLPEHGAYYIYPEINRIFGRDARLAGKTALITDPAAFTGWQDCETLIFTCLDTPEGRKAWQAALAESPAMSVDTRRRLGITSRRHGLPAQTIHLRSIRNDQ